MATKKKGAKKKAGKKKAGKKKGGRVKNRGPKGGNVTNDPPPLL